MVRMLKTLLKTRRSLKHIWCKNPAVRRLATTISSSESINSNLKKEPEFSNAKPFDEIPGPKGLPFLGTYFHYKTGRLKVDKFHEVLISRYREHGKIFKETLLGETVVHIFDPDYVRAIYQQEGNLPYIMPLLEAGQMYRKYRNLSLGLGNTNGEEWYRIRSAVQQLLLRPKAASFFLPLRNVISDEFVARLRRLRDPDSGCVPDLKNELAKLNLESSAMFCFEKSLGCLEAGPESFQQRMIDSNAAMFSLSVKLRFGLPWFKFFPTTTWRKFVKADDFFFGNAQKFVDETTAKIKSLNSSRSANDDTADSSQYNIMIYLLSKPELSYKDVSITAISLIADGLTTTVPSLTSLLYCLARSREKQDKLYEEIQAIAPDRSQPITEKMIALGQYLKACVKEGFRLFPPITGIFRVLQKNIVISGYQLPAGTHVELNNNMLLGLPEYFDDPDSYVPERWLRGSTAENVHSYLLLPFGFGPRSCAGRRFAEQEIYVLVMKLLQNFRLELLPDSARMSQRFCMLQTPDITPAIKFTPRMT